MNEVGILIYVLAQLLHNELTIMEELGVVVGCEEQLVLRGESSGMYS